MAASNGQCSKLRDYLSQLYKIILSDVPSIKNQIDSAIQKYEIDEGTDPTKTTWQEHTAEINNSLGKWQKKLRNRNPTPKNVAKLTIKPVTGYILKKFGLSDYDFLCELNKKGSDFVRMVGQNSSSWSYDAYLSNSVNSIPMTYVGSFQDLLPDKEDLGIILGWGINFTIEFDYKIYANESLKTTLDSEGVDTLNLLTPITMGFAIQNGEYVKKKRTYAYPYSAYFLNGAGFEAQGFIRGGRYSQELANTVYNVVMEHFTYWDEINKEIF